MAALDPVRRPGHRHDGHPDRRRVRESLRGGEVRRVYDSILGLYDLWTVVCAYLFTTLGTPKLMTMVIANLSNLAIGLTAFHLLWVNVRLLPAALRPRWYHRAGLVACGVFFLGLAALVFATKQLPLLRDLLAWG